MPAAKLQLDRALQLSTSTSAELHPVEARRYDRRLPPTERFTFDTRYVARLVAGDAETNDHFARYFSPLLALKFRGRLRPATLADDARQETLLRVVRRLKMQGGLDVPEALGAFVHGVASNVLSEFYRTAARVTSLDPDRANVASDDADVEARLLSDERVAAVRRVMAALPPKDRTVLTWLFFEDRDKDEICRRLNVDRNYLRLLVHRAKARFRQAFGS